ncbi:MAG TPA: hypothetical protein DET40_22615 [Lentisphaeria bacterium]|nr:MAG: hypothetical protein A2X45_17345 [Lentisphaerae bacterium GWF2_50_93]HCE46349.1 hypothetical protein [Lentisphaeria bacterium]
MNRTMKSKMSKEQLNVLLFFSDQHRADVLGCENHPDVSTPNLDKLAKEGVRFERAYCQDGVCVPSRCSFISGLYPRTLGCLDNGDRNPAMDKIVSMQKMFLSNGYLTAAFGKRHFFQACDEGWEIRKSHLIEEHDQENYMKWIKEKGYGKEFARDWAAEWGGNHPEGPENAGEFSQAPLSARPTLLPEDMTAEAYTKKETIELIEKCSKADRPFFIFSSFLRPHQPYTPLPRYYDLFDRSHWGKGRIAGDGIAKPPAFDQSPEELPPGLRERMGKTGLPWNLKAAHEDQQIFRDAIAAYYAGVMEIDACIGEIMAALEKLGLKENTIVIYTSDHGEFAGGHGIMEKIAPGHNIYEDTLRVPLIISCPSHLRKDIASGDLVELVDIYPTLMDLCSCRNAKDMQSLPGRSLLRHLKDGTPVGRKFAVSENWSQAAIITERYKLGIWLEPAKKGPGDYRSWGNMLFDREKDPFELTNCFSDSEYSGIRNRLASIYDEWFENINFC